MGSHSSRTPDAPHTIGEPGSVSGRPRQDPQPDARVGLARLSPAECTLRPSDSCVSIQPTEGHRFYWGRQKGACLVGGVTEPVRHRRPTWWCDRDRDDDRAHRSSSDCRFAVSGHTTQRSVGGWPPWPSRQLEPAYATKPPNRGPRRMLDVVRRNQRHCCTQLAIVVSANRRSFIKEHFGTDTNTAGPRNVAR